MPVQTCRHFRYQLPRELADELRDADPLPCEVCDAMPHRKLIVSDSNLSHGMHMFVAVGQTRADFSASKVSGESVSVAVRGWLARVQTVLRPHHQ
jgi:hypothetical protein